MRFFVASVLVATTAVACFYPSLSGNFVFDDTEAILNNPDIVPSTPWYQTFQNDFWGKSMASNTSHKSYRPLTVLTFRLNYAWSGGLNSQGFHAVNLGLHVICCVMLLHTYNFIIKNGRELTVVSPVTVTATLLFASHPVHSENVAGIVGRADILCAIFYFLAFLAYGKCLQCSHHSGIKCPTHHHWSCLAFLSATAVLAAISMLFKEQGVTVLGLCIVYDFIVMRKRDHRTIHKITGRCAFLACAGVFLLGFRLWVMGGMTPVFQRMDNPASFAESWWQRVLNFNYIYCINAWILLYPVWLCYDWSMGCVPLITGMADARVPFVLVFSTTLAAVLVACARRHHFAGTTNLSMSLALIVIPFLPASNLLFRVGFVVAERVLFLPSSGFCLLVALGFGELLNRSKHQWVIHMLGGTCLLLFVLRSRQRSADWLTEERLFHAALRVCPLNAKVHYNVAKKAADAGRQEEAIAGYREALRLFPQYDQAMNNLANILKDRGQLSEAETLLMTAVGIRQDFAAAWMNLGIVQSTLHKYKDAELSYLTALFHRSQYPDCYYNLGNLYLEQKRYEEAYKAWRNATSLKPTHVVAWNNMIIMLDNQGDLEWAKATAQEAIQILPLESSIHFNMANVLGKLGQFEQSEEHFASAIRLRPDNSAYFTNLGVLYHRWKKYDKAENAYRQALQLDPASKSARNNLIQVLEMKTKSATVP